MQAQLDRANLRPKSPFPRWNQLRFADTGPIEIRNSSGRPGCRLHPDPGEKRHINIDFFLSLRFRWPWDTRLVVPGLTGPKSLCVRLETQEIQTFPSG